MDHLGTDQGKTHFSLSTGKWIACPCNYQLRNIIEAISRYYLSLFTYIELQFVNKAFKIKNKFVDFIFCVSIRLRACMCTMDIPGAHKGYGWLLVTVTGNERPVSALVPSHLQPRIVSHFYLQFVFHVLLVLWFFGWFFSGAQMIRMRA